MIRLNALSVVETLERGKTLEDLEDGLRRVVRALETNGGKGSVTLKLNLSCPDGDGTLMLTPEIKTVEPGRKRSASVFFADPRTHELLRNNPRQDDMFEPEMVEPPAASRKEAV